MGRTVLFVAAGLAALTVLAPVAALAVPSFGAALNLGQHVQGNETASGFVGQMAVQVSQAPTSSSVQLETALYAGLDSLKIGQKFDKAVLATFAPTLMTTYTFDTLTLTDIQIKAPDVVLTFTYAKVTVQTAAHRPG